MCEVGIKYKVSSIKYKVSSIKYQVLRVMDGELKKIKSFTDLVAWQEGHKLVLMIYDITKDFPKDELFALNAQIKRCVISITSNIAEAFSRQSPKEKIQFYSISLGSITELQNQLLIARDVQYINNEQFQALAKQTVIVHKLVNGLIKSCKTMILNT